MNRYGYYFILSISDNIIKLDEYEFCNRCPLSNLGINSF